MRLRVFQGERTAEAMAACRRALGPDALILSTRRVARGVEVTAASEEDDPPSGAGARATWHPVGTAAPHRPPATGHDAATGPARTASTPIGSPSGRMPATPPGRFAPLPDPAARPLAFVGPPGAGKTLSCAKLATRLVLGGTPPLVLGADSQRAGAHAQLAAFARVLDIPVRAVDDAADLPAALARADRPVLLDTAGCDPFEPAEAAALLALLRAAAATPVLVLPSGLDPTEAAEIARAFAALGTRHLLPTRLDRPRRLDGILAAAAAGPLALTEAGTGPGAADGLTPITPAWLDARLAATPPSRTPP